MRITSAEQFINNGCNNCGSDDLEWDVTTQNKSGVVEGRLKSNEIGCVFYLGCMSCSETLLVIPAEKVAEELNQSTTGGEA